MKRSVRILLEEILDSAERIQTYTHELTYAQFTEDVEKQDAVIRRMEIIGDAVKGLPDEFRTKYDRVPWRKIAGARDVLIHEYFRVDLGLTWDTIKQDIPELISEVRTILVEMGE